MKIFSAVLLALSMVACKDDVILHPIDGEPCVVLDDGRIITGPYIAEYTCHPGKLWEKQELDGTYKEICVDSWLPMPERCPFDPETGAMDPESQGVDFNCDGIPNNLTYFSWDYRDPCRDTQLGVCAESNYSCVDGKMVCVPPSSYGPEVCDVRQLDENCNGLSNEDDPTLLLSGPEYGYDGDPSTNLVGECRPWHNECIEGHEFHRGQVLPTPERCGTQRDEDCDGLIDEIEGQSAGQAFVILVDVSGSMSFVNNALKNAICDWSIGPRFQSSLFAIEAFGTSGFSGGFSYIDKITDFANAAEACTKLTDYLMYNGSGGLEYGPYNVWAIDHTDATEYGLTWPHGMDRRVVLFSDEIPQAAIGDLATEEQNVVDDCGQFGFTLGVFTTPNVDYLWQNMTNGACQGWIEYLSPNTNYMRQALENRFGTEC